MPSVVVFEIGSSFGYFRKGFTTTNALTHSLIPRSTVEGLIAAIVGFSYGQYQEKFQQSKIAVQIISPVRKTNIKQMNTNPDWWSKFLSPFLLKEDNLDNHVQFSVPASIEVLVDPAYRIYFDGNDDINDILSKYLQNKESYYTPYLGTSSMIAYTKYIGTFSYKISDITESVAINSVLPFHDKIPNIQLDEESKFAIEEGLTIHIDKERIPTGTYKVIYRPSQGPLFLADTNVVQVMNEDLLSENVIFLPTQIPPQ